MEGYYKSNDELLQTSFDDIIIGDQHLIEIKNIPIYSFCEHHLLPFFGTAKVIYKPNEKVVGLSKINRLVKNVSRKLQTQERITHEIVEALKSNLDPLYVYVELECRHMCVEMRGVQHNNSTTITKEEFNKK